PGVRPRRDAAVDAPVVQATLLVAVPHSHVRFAARSGRKRGLRSGRRVHQTPLRPRLAGAVAQAADPGSARRVRSNRRRLVDPNTEADSTRSEGHAAPLRRALTPRQVRWQEATAFSSAFS